MAFKKTTLVHADSTASGLCPSTLEVGVRCDAWRANAFRILRVRVLHRRFLPCFIVWRGSGFWSRGLSFFFGAIEEPDTASRCRDPSLVALLGR